MNQSIAYSFLVPVDFTEKSIHALQYAADIVRKYDGMVHLLHVVDERTQPTAETIASTKQKLSEYAREQQEKLKINLIPNIVTGNIFISIGETAKRLGVQLIIMGIHGMHGIQFIIGSFAARVILGSPVPVLLTNGTRDFSDFKNIILPFDMNVPMDHLVEKTIELAKIFNSTIHIFSKNDSPGYLDKFKAENKIKKTIKTIQKLGLNCQHIDLNAQNENIADSVLRYAENMSADLIMVTTQNQRNSNEYIIVEAGIQLIEKSRIPLFFLNPS
jgi:nucleotide-binding universal stress UspA family protein